MNASIYWADVPMEQKPQMHYYNVPCDIDPESPFNPLNIVKKIYKCELVPTMAPPVHHL